MRSDRPVSFAPAFESAVRSESGFSASSRERLSEYAGRLGELWWPDTIVTECHTGIDAKPVDNLGARVSGYPALVETAVTAAYGPVGP